MDVFARELTRRRRVHMKSGILTLAFACTVAVGISAWAADAGSPGASANVPAGMALIPAGKFKMGDPFEKGQSDQVPVHTVYVSAFYMDKYRVTKKLWDEVRNWAVAKGYTDMFARGAKGDDHPVIELTWYDAVKWCNARSEKEGLTPVYYTTPEMKTVYRTGKVDIANDCVRWDADGYRLPTEAEWEKAARGGAEGRRFPWADTDTITHERANYNSGGRSAGKVPDYDLNPTRGNPAKFNVGNEPFTSPVGSFPPNGYALYDMAGNVWDWVWDWYVRDYYASSPDTDPRGPGKEKSPDGGVKLLRGGSWYAGADLVRCSMRGNNRVPDTRTQNIGFRCVRTVVTEEKK
jgi:formylglycine-generating enzyme required for sulfatase activity